MQVRKVSKKKTGVQFKSYSQELSLEVQPPEPFLETPGQVERRRHSPAGTRK